MKTQRQFDENRHLSTIKTDKRQFYLRLIVAYTLVLVMFSILGGRFYYLQVIKHQDFVERATTNRISLIPTPPIRGEIVDANGIVLAHNYPAFSLEITPNKLNEPLKDIIEKLKKYVSLSDSDLKRFEKYRSEYHGYENIPLKLKLTPDEAGRLAPELYRFPGVNISARTFREYPYGTLTSHIIGYIGRISQRDLKKIKEENHSVLYRGTTHIGKMGLEKYYEAQLHGTPGFEEVEKDAQGNVVRVLRTIPPKTGRTLKLTLDIRMQQEADRLLGNHRGAIVAINTETGGILALVSKPSFDANIFIDGIDSDSWNKLNNDWRRPMINRATQGLYPPGSTFKPFMSMAALQSGNITPSTILPAPGAWSLPNSKHKFRDSVRSGHGYVNLSKALQVSSDTFFYRLGYDMGIDTIHKYLSPFGFGQKTGIDLPNEYIGVLPSRAWKENRFRRYKPYVREWLPADTVTVSIGQGYNAYTPLQMAFATSILANNGKVYRPHLVQQLIDHENRQAAIIEPIPERIVNYNNGYFEYVKHAMQRVVQRGGTAANISQGLKYTMAGKTGTAQVIQIKQGASYDAKDIAERYRDHAWFIAFAPVEKPKIAIAVLLENGGWGANAAPIARALADYYLITLGYGKKDTTKDKTKVNLIQPAEPVPTDNELDSTAAKPTHAPSKIPPTQEAFANVATQFETRNSDNGE